MIQRTFAISVFSLFMIVTSSCLAQNNFTDEEVIKLDSMMTWYEQNDSIQSQSISLLDNQIEHSSVKELQQVFQNTLYCYLHKLLFLHHYLI